MTDNSRLKRTLEFDLTDAPMLVHALSIAAATAKMCGLKDAEQKLRAYKAILAQFVPPEAKLFEEEAWAEIGMALATSPTFLVSITRARWEHGQPLYRWSEGMVTVTMPGRQWQSDRRTLYKPGAPEFKAVFDVLSALAPIGCEGSLKDVWNLDEIKA
jgi:hypothetical protein